MYLWNYSIKEDLSLLSHLFICAIMYLCQYEFMCCDLNVCISPNSYVEIVRPQNDGIMKWGGRCLGHENGVFMNGISALKKRLQGDSQPLLPCEDTARRCGL